MFQLYYQKSVLWSYSFQSNPVRTFQPESTSITLDLPSPCLSYWVVLTAYDCNNRITSTPALIGLFEPSTSGLVASVDTAMENTVVSWRSDGDQDLQRQLRLVTVTVNSECPTGVVPLQPQVFTVTPDQGNSVIVMQFGTSSHITTAWLFTIVVVVVRSHRSLPCAS